jgi:hypothetical protein
MSISIGASLKGCLYDDVSLQMDIMFYNTLPLYILTYVSLMSKFLQKSCGKNMRNILLYNPSENPVGKMKISILYMLRKTAITQWDKLGETLLTYIMSVTSLL